MQDAQQQLMAAQTEGAQVARAKAMMEVETLRISQRIEILNNLGTQATLLAGSAIAFLGGESLETVDELTSVFTKVGHLIYVGSGALALVSSLWVIVVSSHLIAMTRDAALRKNIVRASRLLDISLREVRGMHVFAIAFVLMASLTGALLNMSMTSSLLCTCIFVIFGAQMVLKQQHLSLMFLKGCELELDVADTGSLHTNVRAFAEPLRPFVVQKVWEASTAWARRDYDAVMKVLNEYSFDELHEVEGDRSQREATSKEHKGPRGGLL